MSSLAQAVIAHPSVPTVSGAYFDFMAPAEISSFTVTAIASGTAAQISTNDLSANGICRFSSVDATDNKGAQIQLNLEPFQLRTGKDLTFTFTGSISDATQTDLFAGMIITDTSIEASAPSDGIYFKKVDGSSTVTLIVRSGSATIAEWTVATLVASTVTTLAFTVSEVNTSAGTARVTAWRNGVQVFSDSVIGIPSTEALALSCAFQSGEAAIKTYDLDTIGGWQTR